MLFSFMRKPPLPCGRCCRGRPEQVSILIGAEGGFSREEVEEAKAKGLLAASLGKRILRCETAPLAALSVLMYETGNL